MRGANPARNSPRKKHSAFRIIGTMQHCRGLPSYLWYSLGANLAKERSGFSDKCAGFFSDGSFYCLPGAVGEAMAAVGMWQWAWQVPGGRKGGVDVSHYLPHTCSRISD